METRIVDGTEGHENSLLFTVAKGAKIDNE
jgi:hypothetical protein